jgi:hypothetical protein
VTAATLSFISASCLQNIWVKTNNNNKKYKKSKYLKVNYLRKKIENEVEPVEV